MSKSAENENRILIIAGRLEKGAKTAELLNEYMPLWDRSESTIKRYIALAKDKLIGRMQDHEAMLEVLRADAVEEEFGNILSTLEIEAILSSIISGKHKVKKECVVNGEVKTVTIEPTHRDIILAARILLQYRATGNRTRLLAQGKALKQSIENAPFTVMVPTEEHAKLINAA
jgi:hypothetical protein